MSEPSPEAQPQEQPPPYQEYDEQELEAMAAEQASSDAAEILLTALIIAILLHETSDALRSPHRAILESLKNAAVPIALAAVLIMMRRSRTITDMSEVEQKASQIAELVAARVADLIEDKRASLPSDGDVYDRTTAGPETLNEWATGVANSAVTDVVEGAKEDVALSLGFTHGRWLTRLDERVRGSHRVMEGQVRKIGEPFLSGDGNHLTRPGDTSAPISDWINCRCRVVYTRETDDQ